MKAIPIFATPDSREALDRYVSLFTVDKEREAALLGFTHFRSDDLGKRLEELEAEHRLVGLTVAGMRWNLLCKEVEAIRVAKANC